MNRQYLMRLDDACPTMDANKWGRMESLLDNYGIKPMVGVIPHNEDASQIISPVNTKFWDMVHMWEKKGWTIALHGYDHCYISDGGLQGLNPMWARSEFAGVALQLQKEKIRKGVSILGEHGIKAEFFFPPSHTFDDNTLTALFEESDIRIISDTIALYPYRHNNFTFFPQVVGSARNILLPGVFTFCYHPNTMLDNDFERLKAFLCNNSGSFLSFRDIDINGLGDKKWIDKLMTLLYFSYRKVRKLR